MPQLLITVAVAERVTGAAPAMSPSVKPTKTPAETEARVVPLLRIGGLVSVAKKAATRSVVVLEMEKLTVLASPEVSEVTVPNQIGRASCRERV